MNLGNNGERVDITYYNIDYNKFDIYQKSHYKRYEMASMLMGDSDIVADMACGTGYGTMMLSKKCKEVKGFDIDKTTIDEITKRYKSEDNVKFYNCNLLDIDIENEFDFITSFETIEHFDVSDISTLMKIFHKSLKNGGSLMFSTPYNQTKDKNSIRHHKTFYIVEETIKEFINGYFNLEEIWYQDYQTHDLKSVINNKVFIICKATKI